MMGMGTELLRQNGNENRCLTGNGNDSVAIGNDWELEESFLHRCSLSFRGRLFRLLATDA